MKNGLALLIFCVIIPQSLLFPANKSTLSIYGLVETDIAYTSNLVHKNSLDLYLPFAHKFPVILFIHGGSFVSGDRKDFPYAQIGENFQKNGIACALMSYRLSTDSVWPAQPRDVAKAFLWLKENIGQYGGDSTKIFIVGHSAGGHLAALVCTDSTYFAEVGLKLSEIEGCVSMGAMMSDAGSLSSLSKEQEQRLFRHDWFFKIFGNKKDFLNSLPIHHVNSAMPRTLLLLADEERYDPPKEQTVLEFVESAKQKNVHVEYEVLSHRSHMGTVEKMAEQSDPTMERIITFIEHDTQYRRSDRSELFFH
ncbi:MAG: alpha/beta hydrolase [Bacteroidota bacterium]